MKGKVMGHFRNIEEVISFNKAQGNHFFDDEAMRFFNSEIESALLGDLFLTSERFNEDEPKKYTVREALPDGSIRDISEFQQFSDYDEALAFLVEALRTVKEA